MFAGCEGHACDRAGCLHPPRGMNTHLQVLGGCGSEAAAQRSGIAGKIRSG